MNININNHYNNH